MKNTFIEAEILRNQVDWLSSLEEKLIQVQEDLSFYNNILGEFTAKDIVSLELNSRGNTIQESSIIMTITDTVVTADITVNAVILNEAGIANNSYAWCND